MMDCLVGFIIFSRPPTVWIMSILEQDISIVSCFFLKPYWDCHFWHWLLTWFLCDHWLALRTTQLELYICTVVWDPSMRTRATSEAMEALKTQLIAALEDEGAVEKIKLIFEPMFTSLLSPVTDCLSQAVLALIGQWSSYARRTKRKMSGSRSWSEMLVIDTCVWMNSSNTDAKTPSGSLDYPRPHRAQPMTKYSGCATAGWTSSLRLP